MSWPQTVNKEVGVSRIEFNPMLGPIIGWLIGSQLLYLMCYDKALTIYLRYSLVTASEARLQPEQVKRVLEYWSRVLRPGRLGGKLFQESFQSTQKANVSLFPNTINEEKGQRSSEFSKHCL